MEALDPEGYFPYYYFPGDVGRALAKSYGDRVRASTPGSRRLAKSTLLQASSIHLSSSSASTDPGPAQAW